MADSPSRFITIRITVPLPLVVDGGLTRWRVYLHYYGKNHGNASVIGDCLTSHHEAIIFASGKAKMVEHTPYGTGLHVERGTLAHRILAKLVREGRAEILHPGEGLGCDSPHNIPTGSAATGDPRKRRW